MTAARYYLLLLVIDVDISNEEFEQLTLRVVNKKPEIKEIELWLMQHSAEFQLR
jgi:hypothetical protein